MRTPCLSWDAMFKITKIELDLILDRDMYIFFEKGTTGGISYISNRYSKAQNRYLKSYDPKEDSKHIICLDVNNLYGYAMSKFLPTSGFKWIDPKELNLNKYTSNSLEGCVLEIDLEYPKELQMLKYFILAFIRLTQNTMINLKNYILDIRFDYKKQLSQYLFKNHFLKFLEYCQTFHCVKSVCIWSYSGSYFPAFRLNAERYRHLSIFSPNTGKCRPEKPQIRPLFTQCLAWHFKSEKRKAPKKSWMKN